MSEAIAVELAVPGGDRLSVAWDAVELAELRPGLTPEGRLWSLNGELDWERVESLRVLSGRPAADRWIAVAALRPAGAAGHAEEVRAGMTGVGGEAEALRQVLFSTEYGAGGLPRRIGLELLTATSELPLRVAGDARDASASAEDGLARERLGLDLRMGDASGPGVLEVLRRS